MSDIIMHNGYQPAPRAGLVLLSGLDSAAVMHWAMGRYSPVVALGFDYGQPVAELSCSQVIAERRGVRWVQEVVPGIGQRRDTPGRDTLGVSRAFVPARNGILVWHAANVAARLFPIGRVTIVVGCNLDDASGFPDCGAEFIDGLSRNVGMGLAGACDVKVRAPWLDWLNPDESMRKSAIVRWAASRPDPAVLADVRYSMSCYRGDRCGACDACTLRARAFAEAGVDDGNEEAPAIHGGDRAREAHQ